MKINEYNDWYHLYNGAYSFVRNVDHAIDKIGSEAKYQMECVGWNEETKNTLINALDALKDKNFSSLYALSDEDKSILWKALKVYAMIIAFEKTSDECQKYIDMINKLEKIVDIDFSDI